MQNSQPPMFWACAVLVAMLTQISTTSLADVTYSKNDDTDLTVVRLTVTPAAAPVPLFKHRLVAREIDLSPGNAAPYYYRTFLQLEQSKPALRKAFSEDDELSWWNSTGADESTPIKDLPIDKVRQADQMVLGGMIDEQLRAAAKADKCDWGLNIESMYGPEVFGFQLQEFQQSRELSRFLVMRTRLAIAERRYEDAIDVMRMNYRLASDVSRTPFVVCGLIGIAEAGSTCGTVTEFVAAPDSPNLYWALTQLPQPLVDLRRSARFEVDSGERVFQLLHNAESTIHSADEWGRLYKQAVHDLSAVNSQYFQGQSTLGADLAAMGLALVGYTHAKDWLIAEGLDRDRVEQMAVGQVMAVYSERLYRRYADALESTWYVPFDELQSRGRELDRQMEAARPFGGGKDREILPIVATLLPALQALRAVQVRSERDIAVLRTVEALRMYAAEHAGSLPAKLDEIREVPVPLNPATGKPFIYHLDGQTAVLELPLSDGIPGINRRYEITIASEKK
jgi:hypothetical protein